MASHLIARQQQNDAAQKVLDLLSNPFQQSIQLDAFWASLGTSLGTTAALALVFSLLRPRHSLVYAPKLKHADAKHAPPPISRHPFAWFSTTVRAREDFLVDRLGLDAVTFLRFTRMLRNLFTVLSILGVGVQIPINIILGNQSHIQRKGFAIMTPQFLFGSSMWALVVMAWIIDIVVIGFIYWNYRKMYQLRRNYFESPEYQQSLHARSIMIRDIPAKFRNDEGILRLCDQLSQVGHLPKPTIGRNVGILPELIEEHEETVRKLESILAKYLKNPDQLPAQRPTIRPSKNHRGQKPHGKVDAIDYLTDRIKELEAEIKDTRQRFDSRDTVFYGFASWERVSDAHAAAFAAHKKSAQGTKIMLAPRPNDIIWKNLVLTKMSRNRKRWLNAVWITLLTIVWTPINALIAVFLSNLSNLGSVWPAFQHSLSAHKVWWALVQGIAAPGLTSIVYLVLPIIFRRLQIRAGDVTKTSRERHVLRNLYNFFTFNNLIIFSLFSAIWQFVTVVINDSNRDGSLWHALQESKFFLTVTVSLCSISPFWITWLLQRNLGAAIDLAQLWTLFYVWFAKTFMAPTPRQRIEWTAPPPFDYANYYNYFLFYSTVALCFATLQPIVLVVTALYFTIDVVLKKYLLMYVFITKTESGGVFWRPLMNRLIFATLLSNVIIGVVVKARAGWALIGAMAPLLFVMLGFKFYCLKTFDAGMNYYQRTVMPDGDVPSQMTSAKALARASVKFYHPALTKPLLTPMVHAKARHVIGRVYTGRMASEAGLEDSDIAMEPMTQTGQPAQDAPFEIVPEAQQDFAFYKNRSDFRGEGGDAYGRADDLVSERSGTPASFMTGHTRTLTPYNDSIYKDGVIDRTGSPSRESTPSRGDTSSPSHGIIAPIARKPMLHGPSGMSTAFYPASGYEQVQGDEREVSVQHGRYTDPNDDHANLLRDAGDIQAPNGEFMAVDRWQTQGSLSHSLAGTPREDMGSYDYFRSGQR